MASKVRVTYWDSNTGNFYTGRYALDQIIKRATYIVTKYKVAGWDTGPPKDITNRVKQLMWWLDKFPPTKLGGDQILIVREPRRARMRESLYKREVRRRMGRPAPLRMEQVMPRMFARERLAMPNPEDFFGDDLARRLDVVEERRRQREREEGNDGGF